MSQKAVRQTLVGPRGLVADEVRWATTFRTRRRGVLRRPPLGHHEALVLAPCRRVHTFGVRYPLDVVFCDRSLRVLHVQTLPPRSMSARVAGASCCIELLGGRAEAAGIVPGVVLSLEQP